MCSARDLVDEWRVGHQDYLCRGHCVPNNQDDRHQREWSSFGDWRPSLLVRVKDLACAVKRHKFLQRWPCRVLFLKSREPLTAFSDQPWLQAAPVGGRRSEYLLVLQLWGS